MSLLQLPFVHSYSALPSPGRFGLSAFFTAAGVIAGQLLKADWGIAGAYLPVLAAVAAVTWTGGLWPSLVSQVLGATLTLLFGTNFLSAATSADWHAVLIFFSIAVLSMLLILNIQNNLSLQESRARLEMIARSTYDAFWEWDLSRNYVRRGGRAAENFEYNTGAANPDWWLGRVHPQDVQGVRASLQRAIAGTDEHWSSEYRLQRKDGSYATVSDQGFIVRDKKGAALRVLGGMIEISAHEAREEQSTYGSCRDALTGLPDRAFALGQLHRLLERRRYRDDGPLAVLLIDIDHFKAINERFGHKVGDQLLTAVAGRLTRCLRGEDIATRFGDDEFLVLLERVETTTEAMHIVRRIQQTLSVPFEVDGQAVEITVSIGFSFADSTPAEEAIGQADLAMYRAKAQGRARAQLFEPTLEVQVHRAVQHREELQRSFHDGSLQLYHQPIISLPDGKIFGVEALLRWQHPRRGLLQAQEILPSVEEAGLAEQLGQWVLYHSSLCLDRWKKSNVVPDTLIMSLNLSARELTSPALVEEIRELLRNTHLVASSFQIELTEATLLESSATAIRSLERLRDMGVRVALDNFGKGYSYLGRLQDFPISTLKVDGLLIRQAGTEKPQILDAVMALAQKLRLQVIAQGVETPAQRRYLEKGGWPLAQGFLFSEPVPEADLLKTLGHHHSDVSRETQTL